MMVSRHTDMVKYTKITYEKFGKWNKNLKKKNTGTFSDMKEEMNLKI